MPAVMQRSFAAGEVSPEMYGRADMVPYGTGARRVRRFYGLPQGGLTKTPGTKFIRRCKALGAKGWPFAFNEASNQTYHLELGYDAAYTSGSGDRGSYGAMIGSGYIRFTQNKTTIVLPAGTSMGVTAWAANGTYAIRQVVSDGTRHYYCYSAHTDIAGDHKPDTTLGAGFWYRLSANPDVLNGSIYEIPTPYLIDDVWSAYPQQSADTIVFTNRRTATAVLAASSYVPYLLRRFGHIDWDFVPAPFLPPINGPSALAAAVPGAGYTHRYKVTSVAKDGGKESLVGHLTTTSTATATSSLTADVVMTDVGHPLNTGDEVLITSVTVSAGNPLDLVLQAALLNQVFSITKTGANTFTLDGTAGIAPHTGHSAVWSRTVASDAGGQPSTLTTAAPGVVTWNAVAGASHYSVYKEETDGSGLYGFLGDAFLPLFNDVGVAPDMSIGPPQYPQKFLLSGNHPAISGFFAQRLGFANTASHPQTAYYSRVADLFNHSKREPLQDDDAIEVTLAARKVNEIRHLIELGDGQLVLTRGSEGLLSGDADSAITPTTVRYKPQGYRGASTVIPLEIADKVIYALARGNQLLEIQRGEFSGYSQGIDPALFSNHLFGAACGCSVVAMAWAERPDGIIFVVRSDGAVLYCSYLPNQNVRCWSWGETHGNVQHLYKDVAVVPEGSLDTPYFIVQRFVNEETWEYLEAMVPRCGGCEE